PGATFRRKTSRPWSGTTSYRLPSKARERLVKSERPFDFAADFVEILRHCVGVTTPMRRAVPRKLM
ncbi:MAG: hypothetical protein OEU35_11805, partial [Desulfuromonadales bacterium]|nr:hypothetical protein [Desulfuromonadales bacterium]